MDPLSIVASTAGLISLLTEVVKACTRYAHSVNDYPSDVRELTEKVATLSFVLEQLLKFLREENANRPAFGKTSTLVSASDHCLVGVRALCDRLERRKKRRTRMQSLAWPFAEAETRKEVQALHGYIEIYQFALTSDGCSLLSKTSAEVTLSLAEMRKMSRLFSADSGTLIAKLNNLETAIGSVTGVSLDPHRDVSAISRAVSSVEKKFDDNQETEMENEERKHRSAILSSLSSLHFEARHRAVSSTREPKTDQWFLDSPNFIQWATGGQEPVLWCTGGPGVGKTVLVSCVVDHLKKTYSREDVAIAYVYCNFKEMATQTAVDVFSSLARQLAEQLEFIPAEVEDFCRCGGCEQRRRRKMMVGTGASKAGSIDEYLDLVCFLSGKFRNTYILVDALDEYSTKTDYKEWKSLLSRMESSSIRILVTSRPQDKIHRLLGRYPRENIEAKEEDIRTYVNSRIAHDSLFSGYIRKEPSLREKIIQRVVEKVSGMFLLARFLLDQIGDQTSLRNLKRALDEVPEHINDLYDQTISRIKEQGKDRADLALRALLWIHYAKRPFKARELCVLLAVEPEDTDLDEDGLPELEVLTGVCYGLVSIDLVYPDHNGGSGRSDGTMRLVHQTLKVYLDDNPEIFRKLRCFADPELLNHPELYMAATCLTYLSFSRWSKDPSDTKVVSELKRGVDPLLCRYTFECIGQHLSVMPDVFLGRTCAFLDTRQAQFICSLVNHLGWDGVSFPPILIAAFLGLRDALKVLVHQGANINTAMYTATPFSVALARKDNVLQEFLVENGASRVAIFAQPSDDAVSLCGDEGMMKRISSQKVEEFPGWGLSGAYGFYTAIVRGVPRDGGLEDGLEVCLADALVMLFTHLSGHRPTSEFGDLTMILDQWFWKSEDHKVKGLGLIGNGTVGSVESEARDAAGRDDVTARTQEDLAFQNEFQL
ncbi:hypothetical protein DFP73DRAFT_591460 [Morchella snyderi]|nr:hypothetical protein DFP73DRAFT_591460 [Morchella snyderi]